MYLDRAMNRLADLELKAAQAYLRAAQAFETREFKQFFAEMAREELDHARAILEMMASVKPSTYDLAVTEAKLEEAAGAIARCSSALINHEDLEAAFVAIAEMEGTEINSIYESVLHYYTNQLLPSHGVEVFHQSTEVHIRMLREAAGRFGLEPGVRGQLEGLAVKPLGYYKVTKL